MSRRTKKRRYTRRASRQRGGSHKTIYMTYKKKLPEIVYSRWKEQSKNYKIDLSLDEDCTGFLKKCFNQYIVDLFLKIPRGMYKADLWRLCKLYVNGGVYADIDLVPYLDIDTLDKDITFYSCLSVDAGSIFQAFMVNFSRKSPLILSFLISFLMNNPYHEMNGPTFDMYNCLKHSLNVAHIEPEKRYDIDEVKIHIKIGPSDTKEKRIDLHYFPSVAHTFSLHKTDHKDEFKFMIENNHLHVTRVDEDKGWTVDHSVDICIKSKQSIFLFKENNDTGRFNEYITYHGKKILDSRDPAYHTW